MSDAPKQLPEVGEHNHDNKDHGEVLSRIAVFSQDGVVFAGLYVRKRIKYRRAHDGAYYTLQLCT